MGAVIFMFLLEGNVEEAFKAVMSISDEMTIADVMGCMRVMHDFLTAENITNPIVKKFSSISSKKCLPTWSNICDMISDGNDVWRRATEKATKNGKKNVVVIVGGESDGCK